MNNEGCSTQRWRHWPSCENFTLKDDDLTASGVTDADITTFDVTDADITTSDVTDAAVTDAADTNATNVPSVLELNCAVVHNTWGQLGQASLVARLKAGADRTFRVNPDTHYAQLWLGDHRSQATTINLPRVTGCEEQASGMIQLQKWLKLHPEQLGTSPALDFGDEEDFNTSELPFLLKILSIRSPLALQVHPSKAMAEQLHQDEPDVFDANHKPEMAVALTPFMALVGFRPVQKIAEFLSEVQEFREAMGDMISRQLREAAAATAGGECVSATLTAQALKSAFVRIVDGAHPEVTKALKNLVFRIKNEASWEIPEYKAILSMDAEFPGDPGAMAVFLLNLVQLETGEAIFIDVMVPHAYITGDCIECQASSDNVLRAAFTNKRRDTRLMCDGMVFAELPLSKFKVAPEVSSVQNLTSQLYPSPYEEFAITNYQVTAGPGKVRIPALPVASICVVTRGHGKIFWSSSRSDIDHLVCAADDTVSFTQPLKQTRSCALNGTSTLADAGHKLDDNKNYKLSRKGVAYGVNYSAHDGDDNNSSKAKHFKCTISQNGINTSNGQHPPRDGIIKNPNQSINGTNKIVAPRVNRANGFTILTRASDRPNHIPNGYTGNTNGRSKISHKRRHGFVTNGHRNHTSDDVTTTSPNTATTSSVQFCPGTALFVAADTDLEIQTDTGEDKEMIIIFRGHSRYTRDK